jgi:transposase
MGWKVVFLALTIASNFATSYLLSMKSDLIRQKFHELHSAGLTHAEITKELGISLRTASNWAREMRLPRRKGGPRRERWMPGRSPKIG